MNKNYKLDIYPGIVLALLSLFYLFNTGKIQEFTGLGSTPLTNRFVPLLWGSVLLILSIWLIVRGVMKKRKYENKEKSKPKLKLTEIAFEKREVILSFAALFLYVALMGRLGFVIMTALYVFVQILLLTKRELWKKTLPAAALAAAAASVLLYLLFAHVLLVLLPEGIFYF